MWKLHTHTVVEGERSTHIHWSPHPLSHIHLSHTPHSRAPLFTPTQIHTRMVTHTFFFFFLFFRVVEETKMAYTNKDNSDYRSCPLSKLSVLKEGLVFWVIFLATQGRRGHFQFERWNRNLEQDSPLNQDLLMSERSWWLLDQMVHLWSCITQCNTARSQQNSLSTQYM